MTTTIRTLRGIERRYLGGHIQPTELAQAIMSATGMTWHGAAYYAAKIEIRRLAGHPDAELLT